jgi:hypothetical protein
MCVLPFHEEGQSSQVWPVDMPWLQHLYLEGRVFAIAAVGWIGRKLTVLNLMLHIHSPFSDIAHLEYTTVGLYSGGGFEPGNDKSTRNLRLTN